MLFPGVFDSHSAEDPSFVRKVACLDDGRTVAHFVLAPLVESNLQSYIGIFDIQKQPRRIDLLDLGVIPWRMACSVESRHLFVVTSSGSLYCADLNAQPLRAELLGRFIHFCPTLLESTADGAHVLVCGVNSAALWSRTRKQCLWQRTDIDVTYAAFSSDSQRLLCGLNSGQVIEVQLATGVTIRQVASHLSYCTGVALSPQGDRVASIDSIGHMTMTDLRTGAVAWRKHYAVTLSGKRSVMPVCPRFSTSGDEVALVSAQPSGQVIICTAATGAEVDVSEFVCSDIKGCTTAADGTYYFWDDEGTVIAWDRRSQRVWRASPAADSLPARGECNAEPKDA